MSMDKKPTEDWMNDEPLGKIECSSTDCENDLHCFKRKRPKNESYRNGECIECGANLIDWDRLDQLDLSDIEYTIRSLNLELWRYYYWHKRIDEKAILHSRTRGLDELIPWTVKRLTKSVGPPSKDLWRDGTQTPLIGNIVYYAQHAIGCCCRKCIEEWYGINRNQSLKNEEINYFSELITRYIHKRLPNL